MERINSSSNTSYSPAEYKINYVRIVSNGVNEPLDITKMVNFVEIYESLYSPFLTVNINLTDALSLTNALPLLGEEIVEVDIRGMDNATGLIQQAFYIYSLKDRIQISDRAMSYTLCCISSAAIVDMNLKISQSFTGQPSTLVKDIFTSTLEISKPVYSHPTKNVVSYISNYWSPLRNIQFLCDRAVSQDTQNPSYFFYETKKSFIFSPLDVLVEQNAAADYFFSTNPHNTDMPLDTEQGIVYKMYVDKSFDYIDRITTGAYGNRVLTVDTHLKSYQYAYYDFQESFNKYSRLNLLPFGRDTAARKLNSVFRHREVPSSAFTSMPTEHNLDWFGIRLTELASINSQTIFLDVAGRFNIYTGNVINLAVPISHISGTEKDMSKVFDKTFSGRYLVTGIKHMLDRERHTMSLQLNKDSRVNS